MDRAPVDPQQRKLPIHLLVASLYSERYPSIGENLGLSAIVGSIAATFDQAQVQITALDMMEWGEEDGDRLINVIRDIRPDVLAIGIPYGTYSFLKKHYRRLRAALTREDALVVLGGPLATYLGDRMLAEVAPDAVIVEGEADESFPRLVHTWMTGEPDFASIPGLRYRDPLRGTDVATGRRLVAVNKLPTPGRRHLTGIMNLGGEIFVETSRGCSWSACTFCLRGLTDVEGRSYEHRRKPPKLVAKDLEGLADLGVKDVTIADEDFLGGSLDEVEEFVHGLLAQPLPAMHFDASATVHSVFSRRDSTQAAKRRRALIGALAGAGLTKVFLGIESCSPSQLKRYAKGHTRDEAAEAASLLRSMGIRVEIGVILFDPLCTLDEIEDSLLFMRAHQLASVASGISSELRLQGSTHYLTLLEHYERAHDVVLHSPVMDPDTMSHAYDFARPDVRTLHDAVKRWNQRLHPLYYPVKSLSRFGTSGALGEAAENMRAATNHFRDQTCDAIVFAIQRYREVGHLTDVLDSAVAQASRQLAETVLRSLAPKSHLRIHPVVERAVLAAENIQALISD